MNFKLEQNFKLDQRALKGSFVVMNENIRIVESDLNVVFVPKDSRNFYELSAKVTSFKSRESGKKLDLESNYFCAALLSWPHCDSDRHWQEDRR